MSKRIFGMSGLIVGALFLVCGAAFAASQASQAVPAGEPTVPGATYASGLGAPYLTTAGAPRKLAGAGIGAITRALMPLMAASVAVLFLVTYWPALTRWLPALLN